MPGSGSEDPSAYDMVIFDSNSMSGKFGVSAANFLQHGKAVVIFNDNEARRNAALKGVLFAHGKQDTPVEAFFIVRDASGTPQREVQVNFPLHMTSANGGSTRTLSAPQAADIPNDTKTWLADLQKQMSAPGSSGNILSPTANQGQTVFSFDIAQPVVMNEVSAVHTLQPRYGSWCDDQTPPSDDNIYACPSTANPSFTGPSISCDFETLISVLLEPKGASFRHKVITRQYALMSTYPWPGTFWEYVYWPSNSSGNTYYEEKEVTTNGFNELVTLQAGPGWASVYPMTVTEALPLLSNNTTQLTTSTSQQESVGISATGGYQGGGVGLVGVSWSDSWGWSQAQTINIQDWGTYFLRDKDSSLTYYFFASGNTPNPLRAMQSSSYQHNNPSLGFGAGALNGMQVSSVVSQDETTWVSSSGTIGPEVLTFNASATFTAGEVFQADSPDDGIGIYANLPSITVNQPISIDFSNPSLQPPAPAPWTLSFGTYSQSSDNATITGTVALNQAANTDTIVNLTYVIQPQQQMLTLPVGQACAGNTTSFIPGNNVITTNGGNGQPPFTLTIPAGQTSKSFPLSFETFNSDTYNVQIIAWLPSVVANGQQIINPQSAQCLTPPNTPYGAKAVGRFHL
jgi:hypothetical protein